MITCKLGDKAYHIDFISGRALRELEPAAKMYAKIVNISNAAVKGEDIPEADASIPPYSTAAFRTWPWTGSR